jgi:hypothetical protein
MNGPIDAQSLITLAVILLFKAGPILLALGAAFWILPRLPFGRALIRGAAGTGEHGERLLALESEIVRLRAEVAELQERQDFAERLQASDRPLSQRNLPGPQAITPH